LGIDLINETKKKIGWLLLLVFVISSTILFLHFVYNQIDKNTQSDSLLKPRLYYRNIDTSAKKWLNGYLGTFFRFKFFGNINWLAIPLIFYFLFTIKKRERWQYALITVFGIATVALCIKGYTNWRYQFTLFPFIVVLILLLGWEIVKNRGKYIKLFFFSFLIILVSYNFIHYFGSHKYQWNIIVSNINKKYPNDVLKYVNNLENSPLDETKFLICSYSNIFYYYCDKQAIQYNNPNCKGEIRRKSRKELFNFLKEDLKITHIFTTWRFEADWISRGLIEVIRLDCQKIMSAEGYHLYNLREKPIEVILKENSFAEYLIWDSRAVPTKNTSPKLLIQGIRGKFSINYKKPEDQNLLSIHSQEASENKERILQLGYTLDKKTIASFSLNSKYVYFLVSIKIPPHLINKNNYIFIQDFDGKWEREKVFFARETWRKYLIKKKIRPETTEVGIGFKFDPKSQKDEVYIKKVQIYFLDESI